LNCHFTWIKGQFTWMNLLSHGSAATLPDDGSTAAMRRPSHRYSHQAGSVATLTPADPDVP
jgi:hypothetical protein